MMLLITGCLMQPERGAELHRMAAYRPVSDGILLVPAAPPAPVAPVAETNVPAAEPSAVASNDVAVAAVVGTEGTRHPVPVQRILSRGDRIMISLRGIPRPEEIKNVIDGLGEVTLPFISQVRVSGLTTSEAERLIETKYIDGGFYRNINAIVVAEDKVYFVQGEVSRQGKFTMSGDVTLLQAITEAGGYTPFANRKNVKVIRGDQVLFYNARDIADGKLNDPPVLADDIIVVQRSVF
jgi:polysaccharide export outer membrane protein